jgi:hypothetical protein
MVFMQFGFFTLLKIFATSPVPGNHSDLLGNNMRCHIGINSLKLPAHLYIKSTMHPHDLDPNGHVLVPGCTITRVEEVG